MFAVRCVLESLGYHDNVFLTLTYDDNHFPDSGSVEKEELQKFMKRFRKSVYPAKVRFFASGEYGSKGSKRPHYHLLIFGVGVKNPVFENLSWDFKHQGFWCECKAWKDEKGVSMGHCFVGNVTIASAQYVAQYVLKKWKGKGAKKHYDDLGIKPEFCLCSRRPGLGLEYLKKNRDELLHKGYVSVAGVKHPLPRYFQDQFKKDVPFYELFMSGETFKVSQDDLDRINDLEDTFDDYHQVLKYLSDENKQRAMNIEKKYEFTKGTL